MTNTWELNAMMTDTLDYVQVRVVSIESYMSELKRLKERLMTTPTDENHLLIGEFNYNVHMMVISVEECVRKWDATLQYIRQLSQHAIEWYNWILNVCYTLIESIGVLDIIVLKRNIHDGLSTEDGQLELDLRTTCYNIDQSKSQLHIYMCDVQEIVQQLHDNDIRVNDVPT